jgi:hypothetical protein
MAENELQAVQASMLAFRHRLAASAQVVTAAEV